MKHYLALFFLFFLFHSTAFATEEEPPFIAHPTIEQLFESCKQAVALYDKRDPDYVMTGCISEMRGMMGYSIVLEQTFQGLINFDKIICGSYGSTSEFLMFDRKDRDPRILLAEDLIQRKEKSLPEAIKKYGKKHVEESFNQQDSFGIIPAIFEAAKEKCNEINKKALKGE